MIIRLTRSDDKALKFDGVLVAKATTRYDSSGYENNNGRGCNYKLYKTKSGNYIANRSSVTCWQGEDDEEEAVVCKTESDVFNFFGSDCNAQELYEIASLRYETDVD